MPCRDRGRRNSGPGARRPAARRWVCGHRFRGRSSGGWTRRPGAHRRLLVGPVLPRDPGIRLLPAEVPRGSRTHAAAALGEHPDRVLRGRSDVLPVLDDRFRALPSPVAGREGAAGRDYLACIADQGVAAPRVHLRDRLASHLVGTTDGGAHLAPAPSGQVGRQSPPCERRLHLGDHRADVLGPPLGPEARGVRLRGRWLRDHPARV